MALASTELTAPANSTPKPTTSIAAAAIQAEVDASVPRQTSAAPATASASSACSRARIEPLNSTNSSSAKEPNAANVAMVALPITSVLRASIAGITTAARPARRSAMKPGSRCFSHCSGAIRPGGARWVIARDRSAKDPPPGVCAVPGTVVIGSGGT